MSAVIGLVVGEGMVIGILLLCYAMATPGDQLLQAGLGGLLVGAVMGAVGTAAFSRDRRGI